ncbi:hypothetical protein QO259_17095 [Salinicola sp. JS01]|uniref:hypothetical protein n=1 Tax=Salinicola sp. JS01 TaxID=3050071 RepID=UPI00255BAB00|nr:hypothetical protein [Salinicola sp. JS01]WIX32504.1 hypothetical protein QO259_17095 [Salinicola sp. JS01]
MAERKGGSYYMREGKPVLKFRTGHKPEPTQPKKAAKPKPADSADVKQESSDASA